MSKGNKINFTLIYYLSSLVILIIVNGFLIQTLNKKVDETRASTSSIQVIETNLDGIESGVLRGFDAGLRGYAFVQDEEILHPYDYAFDLKDNIFHSLELELKSFNYDPKKVAELKATIESYGEYMKGLKELVDKGEMEYFIEELSKNAGNETWQDYNSIRVDLKNHLEVQTTAMNAEIQSFQRYTSATQLGSIILVFIILILIYRKIIDFAREKDAYIQRIQEANLKLEASGEVLQQEVAHKTRDLRTTNQELKSTLAAMKTMQAYMLQSEKMTSLGTMTAGISHEFNNGLNHIQGGLSLINRSLDSPNRILDPNDCETAKNIIDEGISRMTEIVKSLQMFSERSGTAPQPTDIHQLIENSIIILKSKINEEITFIKKLALQQPVQVKRAEMQQVIVQLLDNAIFAVASQTDLVEKRIEIHTSQIENKAIIEVCNNGPQIPREHLNELFDPFYTTKDPGAGTGLGLSICYSVVSEHDGTIVATQENGLVKFQIELPIV